MDNTECRSEKLPLMDTTARQATLHRKQDGDMTAPTPAEFPHRYARAISLSSNKVDHSHLTTHSSLESGR